MSDGAQYDEFISLIPAKLPTKRVEPMPEQKRKPFCVIALRGMMTSFCGDEGQVAFYETLADRNGGGMVFVWSETEGRYVVRGL